MRSENDQNILIHAWNCQTINVIYLALNRPFWKVSFIKILYLQDLKHPQMIYPVTL